MALTDKEVLSDASELVTELVIDLQARDVTPQDTIIVMADVKRILMTAANIIDVMVMGDTELKH